MGFAKYASTQVLSVERETSMSRTASAAGLQTRPEYEILTTEAGKTAHRAAFDYVRRPGYIYVRSRAISSRTNDNYDDFPAEEIKKAWRTFIGKPVFVNHHNDDHRRARGVIIDAALHEDTNPDGTPDTWTEVLMEVDAVRFPRLAEEVAKGNIARTSMGTNVEYSVCTACGNKAASPVDYCQHIPRMKGMKIRRTTGSGGQEEVLIAERCYGLGFFENSLLVEDPADPTAYVLGVEGDGIQAAASRAFDGVTVSREDITTWHPDPADVVAANMREAMKQSHWQRDHHTHTCKFPVSTPFGISACHSQLDRDGACAQHGPQLHALQVAAATNKATCDGECGTDYDYSRVNGTATFHVPSNGMRGGGHQPAHDVTVEGTDDGDLWHFECPVCGYDNSQYNDAETAKALSHLAKTFSPMKSGNGLKGGERVWVQPSFEGVGSSRPAKVTRGYDGKSFHVQYEHQKDAGHDITDDHLKSGDWIVRHGALEPATDATAICDGCGHRHPAEYSHEGEWNQGHIYAVTCDVDGLTSYHTEEGIDRGTRKPPSPYLDFSRHSSRHTAQGEVKAPAQVDTMRAERCPVCQDDEAYDGERCGICGYVAPPEMFQDPDLEKAQQVDLRQDALETPDADGNMQVATDDVDGIADGQPVLTCDACGEEFGADAQGDDSPDTAAPVDPAAEQDPKAQADVDSAGDPTHQDSAQAPDDLSDLADKTDEELGLEDQPDAQKDQAEAEPQAAAPADDEGGLSPLDTADSVDKGDVCPICGQGTIVSIKPESTDPGKNPKEVSRAMPENDKTPANPAKAARNQIIRSLLGQQQMIEQVVARQAASDALLLEIGKAAGLQSHPRFAALQKQADDTNQTPETTPATTSDDAKQPDAKDDVNNVGASPEGANVNVTPQAVTDVASTDKVEPGQAPLTNLVDVTEPVAGAQSVPAAGPADKVINPVTVGTPDQTTMDPAGSTGWKSSAKDENPQERYTASMRLARLRIAAGLARGEDLALGEEISKDATLSLDTINALAAELSQTLSVQAQQAPTRRQAQTLVPRAAGGGRVPSLAGAGEGLDVTAGAEGPGLDEWAVGMDTLDG